LGEKFLDEGAESQAQQVKQWYCPSPNQSLQTDRRFASAAERQTR